MHAPNACFADDVITSTAEDPIPNYAQRELRMVVTQRCNYACGFCHKEGMCSSPQDKMSSSDIGFLFRAGASLGLQETTLSGGEPLVRNDIDTIASDIHQAGGKITVTTNGVLLEKRKELVPMVKRFNVSLHSLEAPVYEQIVQRRNTLSLVMNNIRAVRQDGAEVRLNAAIQKGLNDSPDQITRYIDFANETGSSIKYLELYPSTAPDYVPIDDLKDRLVQTGYTPDKNNKRSTKMTKSGSADIFLSKIFCAHAAATKNPSQTCQEQNDIFVSPDGTLKPCRELPLGIDALADVKARDIVGVRAKIREAFACLGQNCPLQK